MKKVLAPVLILLMNLPLLAQDSTAFYQVNYNRNLISRNSMVLLGSWGLGNMAAGGIGWALAPKGSEAMYFSQMNLFWNVVNVGIAVPGYLRARKSLKNPKWDAYSTFKDQRAHETVYLINMALDVAYVGTGVWMLERANTTSNRWQPLLKGYGGSLIMQGSFLLINDLVVWLIDRANWRRHEPGIFGAMQVNGNSIVLPIVGKRRR